MRTLGPPSEIRRLATPVARLFDAAWERMHWWIAVMVILYAFSGITIVKSDEVAVVLRWGRLVGDTPALQEHGSGLLFAFPRPIDRVVRVQAKHVSEETIVALTDQAPSNDIGLTATLDPLTQGYALTGDQNIVHAEVVARYRIRDVAEWAFYGPLAVDVLRLEVTAAMVRSLGEVGVDRVLSDERKDLIAIATRRAQAGLDRAHSGLELASLELTRLAPPLAVAIDFESVQSAFIATDTKKKGCAGVRGDGHSTSPGQGGCAASGRESRRRVRARGCDGRRLGIHRARARISGQSGRRARATLPRCD